MFDQNTFTDAGNEKRHVVRWDDDHAHWVVTKENVEFMDAYFYVRIGELAEGEDPRNAVITGQINVRFLMPTTTVQARKGIPKWHSDKVRIYLRSHLHKQKYEFYPNHNLALKRGNGAVAR